MKHFCVIPARMASSRFPGKPLFKMRGHSMLEHIIKRCQLVKDFSEVVVATCDQAIVQEAERVGVRAIMTADTHERCTDRVAEAVRKMGNVGDQDHVLMVQGDEVVIPPSALEKMTAAFEKLKPDVLNLVTPIFDEEDIANVNVVKVVLRLDGQIMLMGRSALPSGFKKLAGHRWFQQGGVIGFSASFLQKYSTLNSTPLEIIESIDMMRVLEHGYVIQSVVTDDNLIGVDTPEDAAWAEKFLETDSVARSLFI